MSVVCRQMTRSAGLAVPLAGLLLVSAAAGDGLFPSGGSGQFGARLSPRSLSVHNSYPAVPYGGQTGGAVGSGNSNAGSGYSNVGSEYSNVGSGYDNIGSGYNVGSGYSNAGSGYNNAGNNNNVANNYDGSHSVYIRNDGYVADSGYTVKTANSDLRAQSVHAVRPADDYQANHLGDYDGDGSFQYRYMVSDPRTGDAKSQHETRDGDTVTGEYRVLEANGLMRIVSYTADDAHGFVANVRWVPGERPHGASVSHQEVTQQQ